MLGRRRNVAVTTVRDARTIAAKDNGRMNLRIETRKLVLVACILTAQNYLSRYIRPLKTILGKKRSRRSNGFKNVREAMSCQNGTPPLI